MGEKENEEKYIRILKNRLAIIPLVRVVKFDLDVIVSG